MKTKLILVLFTAIALGACQKETTLKTDKIKTTETEAKWDVTVEHSTFSSTEVSVEKSCALFNDEISGLVNGIHAAFVEQAKEQIARLDSAGLTTAGKYELMISDTAYIATPKYISVLVQSYEFLGCANGNTNYYALNYDVQNGKFLNKTDLLDSGKAEEINALLKTFLKDPDNCYTFEDPSIDNCSAINFTHNSVEFTYGKYILGPGACGPVTISIPAEKLTDALKINIKK